VPDVPQWMRDNFRRGLDYHAEGKSGDGLMPQTVREAGMAANEGQVPDNKPTRMAAWFARHMVDLDTAPARGDADFPSPGQVAHLLWGGGTTKTESLKAQQWAERTAAALADKKAEKAVQEISSVINNVALSEIVESVDSDDLRRDAQILIDKGYTTVDVVVVKDGDEAEMLLVTEPLTQPEPEPVRPTLLDRLRSKFTKGDGWTGHDIGTTHPDLTGRQSYFAAGMAWAVADLGPWPQSEARYVPQSSTHQCQTCVAYLGGGRCQWVSGAIEPEGSCSFATVSPVTIKQRAFGGAQTASEGLSGVFMKSDERRFTLGPWYVPDSEDAHGEWTDADELQAGLWNYVRKGDRRIRLQHNTEIVAGEWLEALTWPYDVEVPLTKSNGMTESVKFPAGTVFMGVQWESWAWELVKAGQIRGFSMGGRGDRVMVDLPAFDEAEPA
jgi:hypothetical protein